MREFILQFLASSLTEGSIYGLMALGLVIILRSTEVLFFGQGAMAMVGGSHDVRPLRQAGSPSTSRSPAASCVCVIISLLSLRIIVLPLLARGAPSLNVSMVTIGVSMIFEMLAMIIFGKDPLAVPSFSGDNPVTIFGASFVPQHFWILGFTAVVLVAHPHLLQGYLDGQGHDRPRGQSSSRQGLGLPRLPALHVLLHLRRPRGRHCGHRLRPHLLHGLQRGPAHHLQGVHRRHRRGHHQPRGRHRSGVSSSASSSPSPRASSRPA